MMSHLSLHGLQVDGNKPHASGEHLYLPTPLLIMGDLEGRRVAGSLEAPAMVLVSVVINGMQCGVAIPTTLSRSSPRRWDVLLSPGGLRRSLVGLRLSWSAKEVPQPPGNIVFDTASRRAFYRPMAGQGNTAAGSSAVQQQERPLAFGYVLELAGDGVSTDLPLWTGRISLRPWPEVMASVLPPGSEGELLFSVVIIGADMDAEAGVMQLAVDTQTAKYVREGGRLTRMQWSEALKLSCRGRAISWAIGEPVEGPSAQSQLLVLCVHHRDNVEDSIHATGARDQPLAVLAVVGESGY